MRRWLQFACVVLLAAPLYPPAVGVAGAQRNIPGATEAPAAQYGHSGPALLQDAAITPGAVRTTDANAPAVCGPGSTKQFRHTTAAMKALVYRQYGAVKKLGMCCEVDHLISLELGGADEVTNLWPQPYEPRPGAYEKDQVENWLHAQVCAGKMRLADAQKQIATDWYAVYLKMPRKSTPGKSRSGRWYGGNPPVPASPSLLKGAK